MKMLTLLDRYIVRQLLNYVFLGIVVFTLVLFFSDALLDFMKDLQHYGITYDIALTLIGLQIPKIVAIVIPMSALLATLMVYNTMNNQFELIAIRMSGVSLIRLSVPAVMLGILACISTYILHDYLVPLCNRDARALKSYAVDRQNLPATHENFIYKQFDKNQQLKRLLYVSHFHKTHLGYTTLIDLTNPITLQITQARSGLWGHSLLNLQEANVYTVSSNNKVSNTTHVSNLELQHFIEPPKPVKEYIPSEQSFWDLRHWLNVKTHEGHRFLPGIYVNLWEKLTVPLSALPLVLIGVPLAMTSPRKASNIGFPLSIFILFCYYLIRHISVQLGNTAILPPLLAASLPIIVLSLTALVLYQRKSRTL